MKEIPLYPLRFVPTYQYRVWGGRRLHDLLSMPLPGEGPIGEAWLLSDRGDHAGVVADGALKGETLRSLLENSPEQMLGQLSRNFGQFPLLLKFLDVRKSLSVQVHPSDTYGNLIPAGNTGKSEAWLLLEQGPEARIYAGLKVGTTAAVLRKAIETGDVADQLASFSPRPGDSVLIHAGTVHSLTDVVVFEVQRNSDVTFRLYDWNQVDLQTRQRRPLQVEQAMACIDFGQGAIGPQIPLVLETRPALKERLIHCEYFGMTRISGRQSFIVGESGVCRALLGLTGNAHLEYGGSRYPFGRGDILLLPAAVGACCCRPDGFISLLEISLPEAA